MATYGAQFKAAPDTFGKDKISLSGKAGGMKDDMCICEPACAYVYESKSACICIACINLLLLRDDIHTHVLCISCAYEYI